MTHACVKNATDYITFNGFGFGTNLPAGAVIESVTIYCTYKVSTTSSTFSARLAGFDGTTQIGISNSDTTESLTDYTMSYVVSPTPTLAQLADATFGLRWYPTRGSSNTAVTDSVNVIYVTVQYSIVEAIEGTTTPAVTTSNVAVNCDKAIAGTSESTTTVVGVIDVVPSVVIESIAGNAACSVSTTALPLTKDVPISAGAGSGASYVGQGDSVAHAAAGLVCDLHAEKATGTAPGTNSPQVSTWTDLSGNANHGTLKNISYDATSGWIGSGTESDPYMLKLDGSNDYVDLGTGSTINLSSEVTLEYWMKGLTSTSSTVLFGKNSATGYYTSVDNGYIRFFTGNISMSATATINDGGVYHVVAMRDSAGNKRIYINGSAAGTGSGPMYDNASDKATLGGMTTWGYSNVAFATLRIYNRALTSTEVTQNYEAGPIFSAPAESGPTLSTSCSITVERVEALTGTSSPSVSTFCSITLDKSLAGISTNAVLTSGGLSASKSLVGTSNASALTSDVSLNITTAVTIICDSLRGVAKSLAVAGDTVRPLCAVGIALSDTRRSVSNSVTVIDDTSRHASTIATVHTDSKRLISKSMIVLSDTLRRVISSNTVIVPVDTVRRVSRSVTVASDTKRIISKAISVAHDTRRRISNTVAVLADTLRNVANISVTVLNMDTVRRVSQSVSVTSDTRRIVGKAVLIASDASRRISNAALFAADTMRNVARLTVAVVSMDTLRRVSKSVSVTPDTMRWVSSATTMAADTRRTVGNAVSAVCDTLRIKVVAMYIDCKAFILFRLTTTAIKTRTTTTEIKTRTTKTEVGD